MYTEIAAALNSGRMVLDIFSASKELRNYNELSAAISELNAKLLTALGAALASQEQQATLAKRVRLLEQQIMEFKNFEAEAKNYELKQVGAGIFAYIYKPIVPTSKPQHWVCTKCFESRQIFTLQVCERSIYECLNCGLAIEPFKDGRLVEIGEAY